jgi:hypothetical protein
MLANKLDIRGRIYISSQGINAQFGGTTEHALQYVEWLRGQVLWKVGELCTCAQECTDAQARTQARTITHTHIHARRRTHLKQPTKTHMSYNAPGTHYD